MIQNTKNIKKLNHNNKNIKNINKLKNIKPHTGIRIRFPRKKIAPRGMSVSRGTAPPSKTPIQKGTIPPIGGAAVRPPRWGAKVCAGLMTLSYASTSSNSSTSTPAASLSCFRYPLRSSVR